MAEEAELKYWTATIAYAISLLFLWGALSMALWHFSVGHNYPPNPINTELAIAVDACDENAQAIAEQVCEFGTHHKCAVGCEDYRAMTVRVK